MLKWLPAPVKGVVTLLLMVINTVVLCAILFVFSFVKLALPVQVWRTFWSRVLIVIAETWIGINNLLQRLTQHTRWCIEGIDHLRHEGWYFVSSNHQSWTDILVLQRTFNRRIPFLKFFLKQELIRVPFLGLAWWALDFPFMQRHTPSFLKKHPELKGKDLETTRKACEKFRHTPVSVMNFFEGTRFTVEKHDRQRSPYRHLLKPKAGGAAFVLGAMGTQIKSLLDVTIHYPDTRPSFWDFVCGRIQNIVITVQERHIPEEMSTGDYENDPAFRARFQQWICGIWAEKDALLEQMSQHNTHLPDAA